MWILPRITRCRPRVARSSALRAIASRRCQAMSTVSVTSLLGQMSTPRLEALFGQDARRAADWVFVAAVEGLPQAQVCYGRMLLEGTGVPKDHGAALTWFERAAANGDIDAINMVGRCLD